MRHVTRARARQRGQGLVEYGLIAACVAFVAMAALNILSTREATYFGALPLSPVAPSAPGALLHATTTTMQCNQYRLPALLVTPLTCKATVQDDYLPASDRKPPWGTVTWTFPDGSTLTCSLPKPASGSQTSCAPKTFTAPWDAYIPGTYTVTAVYQPTSNHFVTSATATITIDPPVLTPTCTSNRVPLGNPLACTVTLTSNGTPVPNQTLTWRDTGPPNPGVGIFTCRTQGSGYSVWTSPECPAPTFPTPSLACDTNASGVCGVIYRRLYDTLGGGAGAKPDLSVRLVYSDGTTSTTSPYGMVTVDPPASQHPTLTAAECSRVSGNASVGSKMRLPYGATYFDTTPSITISPPGTAKFTCSVKVADQNPNPALSGAGAGNPDTADAHPPLGSVDLTYVDVPNGITGNLVGGCALQRVATTAAAPPAQAPGQEPFFAECTTSIALTDAPVSSGTLQISYVVGEAPPAGHAASTFDIPITFN